jgi:integrase
MKYTVIGKGGLIREIAVPIWLSQLLEASRREPVKVTDREIFYTSCYDIGYGQNWSQSFTTASKKAIGISRGGHGLRHSFAKWRLHNLVKHLLQTKSVNNDVSVEEQALLILSQELGHFRMDIVFTYLR